MRCRICDGDEFLPLWHDGDGYEWWACLLCGSHVSTARYNPAVYSDEYLTTALVHTGGMEKAKEQVRSLVEWLDHHKEGCVGHDLLDVGCLEGAMLAVGQEHGWSIHGWDKIPAAHRPGCTTITPYFAAGFFGQQFDAVTCKDVIEHVEGFRAFLSELAAVTARGGLLLIQTPRPMAHYHPHAHQKSHLFIISLPALELAVLSLGFRVLDKRHWTATETGPAGQAILLRKIDGL